MGTLWDRSSTRINYQVPVGVLLRDEGTLHGSVCRNVSVGGMFVDTQEDLAIGTHIVCNVPFGRDNCAMQLEGRVAWRRSQSPQGVQSDRPMGVGIQFVDLSGDESALLAKIVGPQKDQSHSVRLSLPELGGVLQAKAQLTPQGIFFRASLPFLKLNSDVEFSFDDDTSDESFAGKIVGVQVQEDPHSPTPRLQVEVALASVAHQGEDAIPSGLHQELSYDSLELNEPSSASLSELPTKDTEPTALDTGVRGFPINALDEQPVDIVLDSSAKRSQAAFPEDRDCSATSGSFEMPLAAQVENTSDKSNTSWSGLPKIEVVDNTNSSDPSFVGNAEEIDASEGYDIDFSERAEALEVPSAGPSMDKLSLDEPVSDLVLSPEEQALFNSGGSRGRWALGALALGVLGVVGAISLGGEDSKPLAQAEGQKSAESVRALIEAPAESAELSEAEMALDRIRSQALAADQSPGSVAKSDSLPHTGGPAMPAISVKAGKSLPEATKKSEPTALPDSIAEADEAEADEIGADEVDVEPRTRFSTKETLGGIAVEENQDEIHIRFAIAGSSEGMRHYKLASPDGIAINLPKAVPVEGFEDVIEPDSPGIRYLWLRQREEGTHFRLYFRGDVAPCKVSVEGEELDIRCTRD